MTPDSEPTMVWRMQAVEAGLREERQDRKDAVQRLDVEKADEKDVSRLATEVAGLRKAVIGFSLTVAVSAIGLVITMLVTSQTGG